MTDFFVEGMADFDGELIELEHNDPASVEDVIRKVVQDAGGGGELVPLSGKGEMLDILQERLGGEDAETRIRDDFRLTTGCAVDEFQAAILDNESGEVDIEALTEALKKVSSEAALRCRAQLKMLRTIRKHT